MAGVYPNDGPYDQYIDITGITELKSIVADGTNLLVGGSVTLSQLMKLMEEVAGTDAGYFYCDRLEFFF